MRQNIRRAAVAALAAISLALLAAGCAAGSSSDDKTLRVAVWGVNRTSTSIKDAAKGFEQDTPTSP